MKLKKNLIVTLATVAALSLAATSAEAAPSNIAPVSDSSTSASSTEASSSGEISELEVQAVEKIIQSSLPEGILDAASKNSPASISSSEPGRVSLGDVSLDIVSEGSVSAESDPQESSVFKDSDNAFLMTETSDGAQVLFTINDASSAHERSFTVSKGKDLVAASTYGDQSGEIFVLGEDGGVEGVLESAWAYDANSIEVPTHYEIDGNTLTQVVSPGLDVQYPIVADPSLSKVANCAAAITVNAGLLIAPGGIIARLLLKGNSIRRAAIIIVRTIRAKPYSGRVKALETLAFRLGASLTGISALAAACK